MRNPPSLNVRHPSEETLLPAPGFSSGHFGHNGGEGPTRMRFHQRTWTTPSGATLGVMLLAVVALGALISTARANTVTVQALVTLSPPTPALGEHTVKVLLRDAYDEPIPGARVLVIVEPEGGRSLPGARLREAAAGIYRGPLTFAAPGPAVLLVEAKLPDGVWQGQLPITMGPEGRVAPAASLLLRHRDDPSETFLGWVVVGAFVLGVTGIAVLGVRSFLARGGPG